MKSTQACLQMPTVLNERAILQSATQRPVQRYLTLCYLQSCGLLCNAADDALSEAVEATVKCFPEAEVRVFGLKSSLGHNQGGPRQGQGQISHVAMTAVLAANPSTGHVLGHPLLLLVSQLS